MKLRAPRVSWIVLSLAACGPQYPIEYETEHLRVAKTFDAPICAGTLQAMDVDAARISAQLGGDEYLPLDVVLGVEAVAAECPSGSSGCAAGGGPVWTEFRSLGHEMVHAFASEGGHVPFVEEGLAEALGGGLSTIHWLEVDAASVALADAFVGPTVGDDSAYAVAGHFVTWLIDRHGLAKFLEFRAGLSDDATLAEISSTFELVYEMSLESAELSWQTTAPSSYKVGIGDCGGPSEAWTDDRHWQSRLELACDAETTFGPRGDSIAVEAGMRRTVLVDVLHDGDYSLHVEATRAGTLEIDSYVCGCSSGPESRQRYSVGTGAQDMELFMSPCRYRISYLVAGVEPAQADINLEFVEI